MQTPAERELAELLTESLNIDWIKPADIDPDAALFGSDLGLDSIDALELALAVSRRYGFQLRSDNPDNKRPWWQYALAAAAAVAVVAIVLK